VKIRAAQSTVLGHVVDPAPHGGKVQAQSDSPTHTGIYHCSHSTCPPPTRTAAHRRHRSCRVRSTSASPCRARRVAVAAGRTAPVSPRRTSAGLRLVPGWRVRGESQLASCPLSRLVMVKFQGQKCHLGSRITPLGLINVPEAQRDRTKYVPKCEW
jgi:hypothetical protein